MTPSDPFRVLLIEDDLSMARICQGYLKDTGYRVDHAANGKDALELIDSNLPHVLLLDLKLPDMDGFDILRQVKEKGLPLVTIVVTSQASMSTAIEAMQLGAKDFLVKPFAKERLITTLKNAEELQHLEQVVETYRSEIDVRQYHGFIGSSLAMQAVYRIVGAAAGSKASVFITGESGTGKEVCAEAIHRQSARAKKPFIAINCGAIPHDLMESEIFGHVKGAFTGAHQDREGAAKQADGGTLFLDEVGEMDISLQPKLLRFLQTGRFQKVGGAGEQEVDVRIVCATNRDPLEEIQAGRFREDLYYRLHVLPILLPPLRDREGDVVELAEHFLGVYSKEEGKAFKSFSPEAQAILAAYPWPGNVRQMQNVIRNIIVLNQGDVVEADMLPSPLDSFSAVTAMAALPQPLAQAGAVPASQGAPAGAPAPVVDDGVIVPLAQVERETIERAIRLSGNNIPRAAKSLGISPATIYRKKQVWEVQGEEP
ncbi:MAG: sigma-54-dependent transcriptional regulator [Magnetovibrionaceae bacterium]